ncbi:hypothetical protein [Halostella litorea]|uniref:hypothetical protein n=1 Tax=Halostella litorea TaxID=2528831 RepID=UPI001091FCEA|nr:hypothetical protein [Halostella litorea]
MRPRVKSSLLWGVVGALSFLVLYQGYLLVDGTSVPIPGVAAVTMAVAAGAAGLSYLGEGWLADRNGRV